MKWLSLYRKLYNKLIEVHDPTKIIPENPLAFFKHNEAMQVNAIIIGQDPYAFKDMVSNTLLATGIPFIAHKPTFSLNIINQAFNFVTQKWLGISLPHDNTLQVFQAMGIAMVNTAFTTTIYHPAEHLGTYIIDGQPMSYHEVTAAYLEYLIEKNPYGNIPILAMGAHAQKALSLVQHNNKYQTIHPAAAKSKSLFNIGEFERFIKSIPYGEENIKKYKLLSDSINSGGADESKTVLSEDTV